LLDLELDRHTPEFVSGHALMVCVGILRLAGRWIARKPPASADHNQCADKRRSHVLTLGSPAALARRKSSLRFQRCSPVPIVVLSLPSFNRSSTNPGPFQFWLEEAWAA
jgi:hypothetical protein